MNMSADGARKRARDGASGTGEPEVDGGHAPGRGGRGGGRNEMAPKLVHRRSRRRCVREPATPIAVVPSPLTQGNYGPANLQVRGCYYHVEQFTFATL